MDFLLDFFNNATDFINDIADFRHSGIYEFCKKAFAEFVKYSVIAMITFKIYAMTFAYDVATQILDDLNLSSALSSAWSAMDSQVAQAAAFFRIPEAINIILSAKLTKFVLKFMGL
jgi:hypothetical protein